jgi:hypothetical protein
MFTGKISPEQLSKWLNKLHLNNFSQVLSISMGVLPDLKVISHKSFREARPSFRKINLFKKLYHTLVRFMVHIISFADQYYKDQNYREKNEQL